MTDHTMKKNPVSIPHTVWHADDIRRGEREAADALGLTLYELMLRAGEAAFQVCRSAYPDARHWLVLCGHGNNGGDGYVVARLATAVGIEVTLLAGERQTVAGRGRAGTRSMVKRGRRDPCFEYCLARIGRSDC
ncbi:hypothetical protein ECZU21_47860 [Escherichia coli]|nr:hypothetical protein ECZU21_47860 [Escherichia coli]